MNTNNIKKYAPLAREAFIAAIEQQAATYGITAKHIEPATVQGEVVVIAGQVFPNDIVSGRDSFIQRIQNVGFETAVDYVAYSWFNRLCALRYLECHNFLSHGRRVLSSADGSAGLPQILEECLDIDLPDLDQQAIIQLKLKGNQDEEIYRLLLTAQCRALNAAMPLLFDDISDDFLLLLPNNLTKTNSLIRDLVSSIPEEDWAHIEIIGWLYQFYISAKKDQVIGKVVKTEDIPAATQLFTPNWIVKYLVQNSVGRLWTMANPTSTSKAEWEYYIQPAEQTPAVQKQLDDLIKTRIADDGEVLDPHSITVLDPACGSGHILVEAYDCLKAMYLERGVSSRDVPRLILENNLYGIDIDDRAAQLASFALLMKAREDDRRLFNNPPKLNIISLQNSGHLDPQRLWQDLNLNQVSKTGSHQDLFADSKPSLGNTQSDARFQLLQDAVSHFEHAKTFGSLISVQGKAQDYSDFKAELERLAETGDTLQKASAQALLPVITQALLLSQQYDAVIANPPYMGSKGMNNELKAFAKTFFPDSKSDLFAMFMERGFEWCKDTGFNSMVTMQNWMFLSSFEAMRENLVDTRTLSCMSHMGNGVMGIAFGTAATVFFKQHIDRYEGNFSYCENDDLNEHNVPKEFPVKNSRLKTAKSDDFKKIPGSPIAYWVSDKVREIFENSSSMGNISNAVVGLQTGDNNRFLRLWQEVSILKVGFNIRSLEQAQLSNKKWFPHNKGGEFRKWYGNNETLVEWENDGFEIKNLVDEKGKQRSRPQNTNVYFKEAITWSDVTSSANGFRFCPDGFIPNTIAPVVYIDDVNIREKVLLISNTSFASWVVKILNPTMHFHIGYFVLLPYADKVNFKEGVLDKLLQIAKYDWDSYETSWDFTENPLIRTQQPNLEQAFNTWQQQNTDAVAEMKRLEEENNKLFIDAYGLQDELTPEVPDEQITLTRADQEKDIQRLISYAMGCMMGRYSLDEPGLIYAHAGNEGFDASRYTRFSADADGIIPLTEMHWFEDDATHRLQEFISTVWGKDGLNDNMLYLAQALAKKNNETPEETVRRYLATKFYKDHLQTYKKRPIYWLFSSGKQGAFQALVYLHRYNESTLARMRTEYVMPLISKMAAYAQNLEDRKEASDSAAEIKRLEAQKQALHKQQAELSLFEEKLRHYADQRISLDLDDGVKVNYAKFGDLLAEVKAVTGEK